MAQRPPPPAPTRLQQRCHQEAGSRARHAHLKFREQRPPPALPLRCSVPSLRLSRLGFGAAARGRSRSAARAGCTGPAGSGRRRPGGSGRRLTSSSYDGRSRGGSCSPYELLPCCLGMCCHLGRSCCVEGHILLQPCQAGMRRQVGEGPGTPARRVRQLFSCACRASLWESQRWCSAAVARPHLHASSAFTSRAAPSSRHCQALLLLLLLPAIPQIPSPQTRPTTCPTQPQPPLHLTCTSSATFSRHPARWSAWRCQ